MIAFEVLTEWRNRGIELTVADGELRYRAPRGVLTPELRATLSAHKAELVAMLGVDPILRQFSGSDKLVPCGSECMSS